MTGGSGWSWRKAWRLAAGSREAPAAVARGAAAGLLVAPTPIFGLHTAMALGLAALARGYRPAAFLASNVSNPLTFLPLCWLDVQLGCRLLGRPVPALLHGGVTRADIGAALGAAWCGGIVIGVALAVVGYPVVLAAVRRRRTR